MCTGSCSDKKITFQTTTKQQQQNNNIASARKRILNKQTCNRTHEERITSHNPSKRNNHTIPGTSVRNDPGSLIRLHQVNSLFLVQCAHGFGKKSENKKKKECTFQSLRPAGYCVSGLEVHALPDSPAPCNTGSTDAVMQPLEGRQVCALVPGAVSRRS